MRTSNHHQIFFPHLSSSKPSTAPSVQENGGEDGLRENEDETEMAEETPAEDPLLVPRVKVAEDGSLIIDEERSGAV